MDEPRTPSPARPPHQNGYPSWLQPLPPPPPPPSPLSPAIRTFYRFALAMNIFVLGMSLVFLWLFPSWAQLGFVLLGITTTAVAIYAWREMQG